MIRKEDFRNPLINKIKDSKIQAFVSTLLIYNLPLLCLFIPFMFKYIMVIILQLIMVYVSMRLFDDANESKRSEYLKIQFLIFIVGSVLVYLYGKNVGITSTSELVNVVIALLAKLPTLSGVLYVVIYATTNVVMCGSGLVLGVLIELAKENQYL